MTRNITLFFSCFSFLFSCQNEAIIIEGKGTFFFNDLSNTLVIHEIDEAIDSITFKVDDVEIANDYIQEHDALKAFSYKIGKKLEYIPIENQNQKYVYGGNHGFIETLQLAYDEHRPIVISPDDIWLLICQGVAIHVNENIDSLESVIFKKDKPKELLIRNDSLAYDKDEWANLVASLSKEASLYTNKKYYNFFVPKFSTTSALDKTAYHVTMLHAFKKVFNYVGESGCGIPYITLTGTVYDWKKIKNNLLYLDDFGLSYWRIELEPIIEKFIQVYYGIIDLAFWKDIYKNMIDYNAFYISGWIIKFFPYTILKQRVGKFNEETGDEQTVEVFVPNKFLSGEKYLLSTLSTDDFPTGVLEVPIKYNNYYTNEFDDYFIYGGFMAIKQHADKTLEPIISWALAKQNATEIKDNLWNKMNTEIRHPGEYWVPYTTPKVLKKPIFQPDKFDDHAESIEYLKQLLADSLSKNFGQELYVGKELSFIVLSNRHVEDATFTSNKEVEKFLQEVLNSFNGNWLEASGKASDNFEMMEMLNKEDKLVKLNYKIKLVF